MYLTEQINSAHSYKQILHTLEDGLELHISLWGRSWITINGYEGVATIDNLARKMMELAPSRPDSWKQPPDPDGTVVQKTINKLYRKSFQNIWSRSLISRICYVFRCIIPNLLVSFFVEGRDEEYGCYRMVSKTQYTWRIFYGDLPLPDESMPCLHFAPIESQN